MAASASHDLTRPRPAHRMPDWWTEEHDHFLVYARHETSVKRDIQRDFDKVVETMLHHFAIESLGPVERASIARRNQELRLFWRSLLSAAKDNKYYSWTTDNAASPLAVESGLKKAEQKGMM